MEKPPLVRSNRRIRVRNGTFINKTMVFFNQNAGFCKLLIENITILAILHISNVYHNAFQIVDYIMTNLRKIRLAKILNYVLKSPILILNGFVRHSRKKMSLKNLKSFYQI